MHRSTSLLVVVLAATGAALAYEPLVLVVGRRPLVETVHVVAGLLLPVPTLLGLWRSPFMRADIAVMNRFAATDWEWLRRRDRRKAGLAVGKFNAGQKLAAALFAGAGVVLFGTGLVLLLPARVNLPVGMRQGATVVHDLFTYALLVLLAGHVWQALRHPEARTALRTGIVDRRYAEREYAAWAASVVISSGDD